MNDYLSKVFDKISFCRHFENYTYKKIQDKNWKDKKSGQMRTKTTWVNCTIWKREGANMRILDFLTRGTLVEILGTPFAKSVQLEDGQMRTEIRLNVSKTNILRPANREDDALTSYYDQEDADDFDNTLDDLAMNSDDFE